MNRRPHLLLASLRHRLAGENGVALVLALGVMLVLGISTSSAMMYATQNQGSAARSKADTVVLSVAEAGINNAMAVLSNPANDPTNANLLASRRDDYEAGSVTWWGTYDAATTTWTITATGETKNPTGVSAAPVRRSVSAKVSLVPGDAPIVPLSNPLWNYDVATRTGNACDQTLNTSVIDGVPFYTQGNMCLSSLSRVTAGPLEVRGALSVAVDATVGVLEAPIPRADIVGGCSGHVCTNADRVFATTITSVVPAVTVPAADWDYWYANASLGPKHPCEQASGGYPTFDNNAVRDKSMSTAFNLTPMTSYTCRVGPIAAPTAELSWDAATRILTVRGTIFIDGQAKIDNAQLDTYKGQGVLYTQGAFAVANGSKMCAVAAVGDCDFTLNAWDPNQNFFTVASNGSGGIGVLAGNGIQLGCMDRFQGGLFATNNVQFTAGAAGAKHQGPIIASTIALAAAAELKPFLALSSVPRGLPGQSAPMTQVGTPRDFTG